ncbi:MAG: squalene/phytoene synthase family protein [Pseudomonadota bacterium]
MRSPISLDSAARQENFPVASRFLAPRLRSRVIAFYRYARTADDIADDPDQSSEAKMTRLAALEDGLVGRADGNAGAVLRRAHHDGASAEDAAALSAAAKLLEAFRVDSGGIRCADWADLMSYCDASAVPVGRYLLIIHGEDITAHGPSDALCAALQVLNHLQDQRSDWLDLGRRYVPGDWMVECGADDADLAAETCSVPLRAAMDRTLGATDDLLARAAPLPSRIVSRGLRAQAAATLDVARRLSARLRVGDPLAGRVALTRGDMIRVALTGVWAAR